MLVKVLDTLVPSALTGTTIATENARRSGATQLRPSDMTAVRAEEAAPRAYAALCGTAAPGGRAVDLFPDLFVRG